MAAINVIACDPGASGSICLLRIFPDQSPRIFFFENNKPVKEINAWLKSITKEMTVRISMVESVHSLLGMSAKSNFSFGKNVGVVNTLLDLQDFGKDFVTPKDWQKFAGVPAKKKGQKRTSAQLKKIVAEIAERLYPGCDIHGPKGGLLDGRSDALMIAHYCAHKYK